MTCHQLVSVTHCSVVVLCGHTHRSSKPASKTTTTIQHNLGRLRFNCRGSSTPLWGVEACSHPSRRPNPIPAIPPYVVKTPHHISMEHRPRRKHLLLNPDTNARKEKNKEKHIKKKKKRRTRSKKKKKKKEEKKRRKEKRR